MSSERISMTSGELVNANTPTGTRGLFALDKVGGAALWFDSKTFEQVGRLDVAHPHQMSIAPDKKTAVISEFGLFREGRNVQPGHHLSVVSIEEKTCLARIDLGENAGPHGSRWDAKGRLWVVCEESGTLLCVDIEDGTIEHCVQVAEPAERAHLVEILPSGNKLYVACKNGPIKVIDLESGLVNGSVSVGIGAEGIACIQEGTRIVAAANAKQDLVVIDTNTNTMIDRIPLQGAVMSSPRRSRLVTLQASPDGLFLLSSNGVSGVVHVHHAADLRKQHLVIVAKGPQGMAVAGDGASFVVANHDAGVATVIGLSAKDLGKPLRWFEAGKGVEALAFF